MASKKKNTVITIKEMKKYHWTANFFYIDIESK